MLCYANQHSLFFLRRLLGHETPEKPPTVAAWRHEWPSSPVNLRVWRSSSVAPLGVAPPPQFRGLQCTTPPLYGWCTLGPGSSNQGGLLLWASFWTPAATRCVSQPDSCDRRSWPPDLLSIRSGPRGRDNHTLIPCTSSITYLLRSYLLPTTYLTFQSNGR